jgi:hypothetical protein
VLACLFGTCTQPPRACDTDLFDEMDGLAPDLDLALLPVRGWGRRLPPGRVRVLHPSKSLALWLKHYCRGTELIR